VALVRKDILGSKSGRLLLFQNGSQLEVWDIIERRPLTSISIDKKKFLEAAFNSNDRAIEIIDNNYDTIIYGGSGFGSLQKYDAPPRLASTQEFNKLDTFTDAAHALLLFQIPPDDSKEERYRDTLRLLNYKSRSFISLEGNNSFIPSRGERTASFSADGTVAIAIGSTVGDTESCLINIWSTTTGKLINTIPVVDHDMRECLFAMAVSHDTSRIMAGRMTEFNEFDVHDSRLLRLWDTKTGIVLHDLSVTNGGVEALALSPSGEQLVSGTYNGFLNLWDVKVGASIRSLEISSNPVQCVSFSPNGQQIVSGSFQLFDAKTGKELPQLAKEVPDHTGFENCTLTFSPNGTRVIWAGELREDGEQGTSGYALIIWDPKTGTISPASKYKGSNPPLVGPDIDRGDNIEVLFSPDGALLITGRDETISVWDTNSWQLLGRIRPKGTVRKLSLSPDGKRLAALEDSITEIWDLTSHLNTSSNIDARETIAFGFLPRRTPLFRPPEKNSLFSISTKSEVKIWDAKTFELRRSFTLCPVETFDIAFSPDLGRAYLGSRDGSIKLCGREIGQAPISFVSEPESWLAITPIGFFNSSGRGGELLSLVRGLDATAIGQVHQSLFTIIRGEARTCARPRREHGRGCCL
jgi:WD40 repeat protein